MNNTTSEEHKPLATCTGCSRVIREGVPIVHASACTTKEAQLQREERQQLAINAAARVNSASDERVVNNVVRHEYRVLSDREKEAMKAIKDLGREFIELLDEIKKDDRIPSSLESGRAYALGKTKIEEAVMWSIKGLTG